MSAIKVYRHAPLASGASAPTRLRVPDWVRALWSALNRAGMRRAAWHLDTLAGSYTLSNPQRAVDLRAAAAQCRLSAARPAEARLIEERGAA